MTTEPRFPTIVVHVDPLDTDWELLKKIDKAFQMHHVFLEDRKAFLKEAIGLTGDDAKAMTKVAKRWVTVKENEPTQH